MNNLPRIYNYEQYDSDNYGVHSLAVTFDYFTLFYSYDTIIAFKDKDGFVMRENIWGTTTGKHMNWLDDDHKKRIPSQEFEQKLQAMLERHVQ